LNEASIRETDENTETPEEFEIDDEDEEEDADMGRIPSERGRRKVPAGLRGFLMHTASPVAPDKNVQD
jgi:hypothetical protein